MLNAIPLVFLIWGDAGRYPTGYDWWLYQEGDQEASTGKDSTYNNINNSFITVVLLLSFTVRKGTLSRDFLSLFCQ